MKWKEVARRGKQHHVLFIDSLMCAYKEGLFGEAHGVSWSPTAYRQFNDARSFSLYDFEKYKQILEEGEKKEKGYLLRLGEEYEKRITAFRSFITSQKNKNWENMSNEELSSIFLEWFTHTKSFWCFGYDYIFINKFLPDQVMSVVLNKESDIMKQNMYLGILFSADQLSELWEEKKSLLLLTKWIKEENPSEEEIIHKVALHLEIFAHLGYYYFRGSAYTTQDIMKRIADYKELSDQDFHQRLQDLEEQESYSERTKELIAILGLDTETTHKILTLKRWGGLSNYVDETYSYAVHILSPLWREIAKRLGGLSWNAFCSLRAREILEALSSSDPTFKQLATSRFEGNAMILENDSIKVLIGAELAAYKKQEDEVQVNIASLQELKGQVASPGNVTGRVRLVHTIHDVRKFERGEILVSDSTNPTYVPAMEKAAAIVTNEGGLLSHAAIVSRELKVPCVVGTKYGTLWLQDDDLIEVDAEKGIIRKLEDKK